MAARRIAVLLSGNGSNLQAMIDARDNGSLSGKLGLVISDRRDAHGLDRARGANIAAVIIERGRFGSRDQFEAALSAELDRHGVDLVVLAGFMRVLSQEFVHRHSGRILNIHPSLLPDYRGLDTYRRVLDAGEAWHGTSVHFVTEELDGGPVIAQARVRIEAGDDVNSLRARVQACEHELYPRIIEWFCQGQLAMQGRRVAFRGEILDEPVFLSQICSTETT